MKRLIACVLLLALPWTAASAEVYKDEIVYALLSPAGGVLGVYVVNGFESDEAGEVTDYGSYAGVVNLSGSADIAYRDGAASLRLPRGRFYYQGNPDSLALPWQVRIAYTLDGAETAPEALSGAQGQLGIALEISPVEGMEAFTGAITLQISVSLDAARCRNIAAEKATFAWAGSRQTLTFVVLPGASAAYSIMADVTDFAMPGIQIAGVRMAMDIQMYEDMARERFAGSPLADVAGNSIRSFLGDMQKAPVVSFADARNTGVRRVQFVLLTQEIAERPAPETPREDGAAETPWTRLLALFGG